MPSDLTPAQQKAIKRLVCGAKDGREPWLDEYLKKTGYLIIRDSDKGQVVVSSREVSVIFGVTARTEKRWRDAGAPVVKAARRGWFRYNLKDLTEWLRDREYERGRTDGRKEKAAVGEDGECLDKEAELAKQRYETARKLKMENDLREERLVYKQKVEEELRHMGARFKKRGEALQRRHGPDIGDDLRELLDQVEADVKKFCESRAANERR